MIVRITVVALLAQILCVGLIAGDSAKSVPPTEKPEVTPSQPQAPPQPSPAPTTTIAPSTSTPPGNKTTTTQPPPPPTTNKTTTEVPPSPTTKPTTTTTGSTPPASSTTLRTTPVPGPNPPPIKPDRKFDAYSFLGGFALCLGLVAIGFLSWKFYISRQENYYHTL